MSTAHLPFHKRLRQIGRRHRRMARNGVVHSINHDGLIIARARRRTPRFPLRGVVILVLAIVLFKGFLHNELGDRVYQQRVAILTEGSWPERVGGWVMQSDAATLWVSGKFAAFLP